MAETLISFPVPVRKIHNGAWSTDIYMWKQLEGIDKYLDCDFFCLMTESFKTRDCIVTLPDDRVKGIQVRSPKLYMNFHNIALKLYGHLPQIFNHNYKNLILFEPFPINLILCKIGKKRGLKIISWFSGDILKTGKFNLKSSQKIALKTKYYIKHFLDKIVSNYLVKNSDLIITDSPHCYRNVSNLLFAPSQTLNFYEGKHTPKSKRNDEVISIIFVGRVIPLKGVHTLLSALAEIRGSIPFHLTIVGPLYGDGYEGYELKLKQMIQEKDLSSLVAFTGNISDRQTLEDHYLKADIFVIPSETEGVPKVIMEAMNYGLPIIASRVGGIPLMVRDGIEGLLVKPGSQQDLIEALLRLAQNGGLRASMGDAARARSRYFSKEKIFQEIAQRIEQLHEAKV